VQFALALATCVLARPLAEAPAKHARMTLYYIPFAVETYVAVTEKTIKKGAYHTIEVDSPERIAALETLAERTRANAAELVPERVASGTT
jgi:hypothetical protein